MNFQQKIEALPHAPGVYLMKGKQGEILYVGKAKVLAHRVRSYFQTSADASPKTQAMVSKVVDVEVMATGSEVEALILENNLIKQYHPRYNVILRDDKHYPFLRLPLFEDYPRLQVVRRVKKDGALYFGPYVFPGALYEMLRLLRRLFPLPNCKIKIDGTADRPCIEYEIKRCLAPCTGNQSRDAYQKMILQVKLFLEGKGTTLLEELRTLMKKEADDLNFEAAAVLRDQIGKIELAWERQRITSKKMEDQDVIAMVRQGVVAGICTLFIRAGRMIGQRNLFLDHVDGTSDEAIYTTFIQQFYHTDEKIPCTILIPLSLPESPLLESWLGERRGGHVDLVTASRGRGASLLDMALENARLSLEERLMARDGKRSTLEKLQELLHLSRLPERIEGYDISNLMGNHAVGSMVVFEGGIPKKSDYRHFKIKTIEGANDFGMLSEVLSRRIKALEEPGAIPPDLILVDGGKGQVSAVREVFYQNQMGEMDLIGLAKERGERGERVYRPDLPEPILLPPASPATHLLMQVRDEAHRFAVSHHRKVRSEAMFASPLQQIEQIGKIRRRALLRQFGSIARIRDATLEELAQTPSMNLNAARKVHEILKTKKL